MAELLAVSLQSHYQLEAVMQCESIWYFLIN